MNRLCFCFNNIGEIERGKDIYVTGIAKTLRVEFKDSKNPYSTALNIMLYSIDFFKPKYNGSLSLEGKDYNS